MVVGLEGVRRCTLIGQAPVDVVLDDGERMARGQLQQGGAAGGAKADAAWVLEGWHAVEESRALNAQQLFQGLDDQAVAVHWHAHRAHAARRKNVEHAQVGWLLYEHG